MVTKQNIVYPMATPSSWGRLVALLLRLWERMVRYRRNRQEMPDLYRLSDRLLDDVGLDRTKADRMFNRSLMAHYRDNLNDIGRRY